MFDEVITGFRVARGGAQERFGVLPDLTILGKIVGGGLPLAAFGGRRGDHVAPRAGRRRLPGGHALREPARDRGRRLRPAAAARPAVYEELERRGALLEKGLEPYGRVQRVGAMLTLFVGRVDPVTRMEQLDTERYAALFRHLLAAGIYVAPSQYECLFPSLAHGDAEIEATLGAVASF